jgi:hypothetical protein
MSTIVEQREYVTAIFYRCQLGEVWSEGNPEKELGQDKVESEKSFAPHMERSNDQEHVKLGDVIEYTDQLGDLVVPEVVKTFAEHESVLSQRDGGMLVGKPVKVKLILW